MLWLMLTSYDGSQLRVNMAQAQDYYPHEGEPDGGVTFIELCSLTDEARGLHVKETVVQIDNAVCNPASPLRLVKAANSWALQ